MKVAASVESFRRERGETGEGGQGMVVEIKKRGARDALMVVVSVEIKRAGAAFRDREP